MSSELAILGAPPTFAEALHVGRPNIGDRAHLLTRINELLDRGWLTNDGPLAREFEARIASFVGVRHCVAMSNGTVALEIALRALGLRGEVLVPAFTFVATAHALQWQEITPVFCDVDLETHNLDPTRLEQMITPRTTGILAVHLWGRPAALEQLDEIARRRGLALVFDAAHAFGASHAGRMVGSFGDAEVFSFHATKVINSFEGGAVVTNDDALAERMRLMRNFGFGGVDDVVYLGTNGKLTEVCAAMGLTSLESFGSFVETNRQNYRSYRRALDDIAGIRVVSQDSADARNFHYVVFEVDGDIAPLHRDELWQVLWAENVLARRYFYPGVHRMEPYRSYFPHARLVLPATERLAQRVLTLPTGPSVDDHAVELIASIIKRAFALAPQVRSVLADRSFNAEVDFRSASPGRQQR